jgi:hypothetical protein
LEETPTGIKLQDFYVWQGVMYRGERATASRVRDSGSEVEVVLHFGDREIELSGYINDAGEFVQVGPERLV